MSAFVLRKATCEDMALLFEWANDAETRRNSFHMEEIDWDEHVRWFTGCLNNPNVEIYICCKNGEPVGQVRLTCEDGTGNISYSVAKAFRGQGIGNIIIALLEEKAASEYPYTTSLSGSVKPENIASRKIFERNNYTRVKIEDGQPQCRYSKIVNRPGQKIGIRVDANPHIGTGHMMRCLSIAAAFKQQGMNCIFFVADAEAVEFIHTHGFDAVALDTRWDDLEEETGRLIQTLWLYGIGKLLVDSYYVTPRYLTQLRERVKVICIDDLNPFMYPVDMLINYNVYYNLFGYPQAYANTSTQLLLGCDYAPLRAEFSGLTSPCREKVKRVLITTGGTDNLGVTGELLKEIAARNLFEDVTFDVIMGRFSGHTEELAHICDKRLGIVLHRDVQCMSELMIGCDFAITAGGTTLYELCACGLPAVTFALADNQLYAVRQFDVEGLMPYAGDMREDAGEVINTLIEHMQAAIFGSQDRHEIVIKMRRLVDGCGALRIAAAIAAF